MTLRRFAAALAAFALAPTVAISHPLDGLTGAEMLRVTEILRAAGEANDRRRRGYRLLFEENGWTVLRRP